MSPPAGLVGQARDIWEILALHAKGLTETELLAHARARWPGIDIGRLNAVIARRPDAFRRDGARTLAVDPDASADVGTDVAAPAPPDDRPRRAVALDLESIVRLSASAPHREQRIYQAGAVRFGRDRAWVQEQREFSAFLALDPEDAALIHDEGVRACHATEALPVASALEDLREFLEDADHLVAYNGLGHDFPLLAAAYESQGLPDLDIRRPVDGLYLALALWPTPPRQHRLRQIADRLQLSVDELVWHDALDDARLLALIMGAGARELRRMDAPLRELLGAVAGDGDALELLFDLADILPARRDFTDGEVAHILGDAMASDPRRRRPPPEPDDPPAPPPASLGPLAIPSALRGPGGVVTPLALAQAARPGQPVEPRETQERMASALRHQIAAERPALIEAPTGTGKSYAMLAAALDWLAGDLERRVVISTFTKQLQSQLAGDIERIGDKGQITGLSDLADLVKGTSNRLSLRALVVALSDASALSSPARSRVTQGVREDLRYRELLVFIAQRLVTTPQNLLEDWEARSVDGVDVPAFFDEYCRGRRGLYLNTLSQAAIGEYAAGQDELSLHTDSVREALGTHRLVIANHALLMANREDLISLGPKTLLLIDEAHSLEDAATGALSVEMSYQALERIVAEARVFGREADPHDTLIAIRDIVDELESLLDTHRLPKVVLEVLGLGEDATQRTLASPWGGPAGTSKVEILRSYLAQLERKLSPLDSMLGGYRGAMGDQIDHFARERLIGLTGRVRALTDGLATILVHLAAVLGSLDSSEVTKTDSNGAAPVLAPAAPAEDPDEDEVIDQMTLEGSEGPGDDEGGAVPAPAPPHPNRVVYLEEQPGSDLARGPRHLHFRIISAPIELPAEPDWRAFLSAFPRTFYVSATLQVSGSFRFVRERLGLGAEVDEEVLAGPFDLRNQARLVCLSDFPSWAEQSQGAIRSVAHQLAGYARECITAAAPGAALRHGAMVLTTSKSAAAGIAERLEQELLARDLDTPVLATEIYGNQRVIESFRRLGGVVCGTKGLWQGVDIEDPERLGLVWVNKLPFAPFADPLLVARRALVAARAATAGEPDPDAYATEHYYLAKGAIELRQAVGRLIRSQAHRGVVVISDKKLAGATRQRQLYRRVFLGSLDPGLLVDDPQSGEPGGGNVVTMAEGWERIWRFADENGRLAPGRLAELTTADALEEQTLLPTTRAIRREFMAPEEVETHRAAGTLTSELLERGARVGGYLKDSETPIALHERQVDALTAVAEDRDLLAVLPTGYGKSFTFQLPALLLPGVTLVVSPLVSLMHDQALELNRSIGGAVRALVSSLPESSSRMGKAEVTEQLSGSNDYGIRMVYVSPERLQQRQFQDIVRRAVGAGIVRRIAIDEAHTLIQWGDDFRPSFRRLERFLADLRAVHPGLRLTAVTATANRTVREGLRRALFDLPPDPGRGGDPASFVYVRANPLRPELALHRRVMAKGEGPMAVAGLVEAVAESLSDHAIFYCLTVREVEALHAQLVAFVGPEQAERVRRYHGRLSEIEKASVTNDFRSAPPRGEEDFRPMIVVATSAFGLGIDRPDIRCVFVVSPPTDLAALYQQLGRAGRDGSGWVPGAPPADGEPEREGPAGTGLALATGRGVSLVKWMTSQDLDPALLGRIADRLLAENSGVISATELARDLVAAEFAASRLTARQAMSGAIEGEYRTAVLRILAILAREGVVDDRGDFPKTVALMAGERGCPDPDLVEVVAQALAPGHPAVNRAEVTVLHARLTAALAGYARLAGDPGATWTLLQDLHVSGYLDVSQAPNDDQLTGVVPITHELPANFAALISGRGKRSAAEIRLMVDWYQGHTCAAEGLREYFDAEEHPAGTCATPAVRCSACWDDARVTKPGEVRPPLLAAFRTPRPRPASAGSARPQFERRLDDAIERLLWDNDAGLTPMLMRLVLRGGDSYYDQQASRRRTLWPKLLHHRLRGMLPGLSEKNMMDSVERLRARSVVVEIEKGRLQLTRTIERRAARHARIAAAATAGASA